MGWGLRLRTLLTGVMILLACQVGEVLAAAQIKSVRIWRAPTTPVWSSISPVRCSTACSPWPLPTVSSSTSAAPNWRPSSTVSSSATPRSPRCAPPSARPTTCAWSSTCRRRSPRKLRPAAQPAIRQPPGGRSLRPGRRPDPGRARDADPERAGHPGDADPAGGQAAAANQGRHPRYRHRHRRRPRR